MEQRRANADWRTHACVERDTSARVGDIAAREVAVQQRIYAGDGGDRQTASQLPLRPGTSAAEKQPWRREAGEKAAGHGGADHAPADLES